MENAFREHNAQSVVVPARRVFVAPRNDPMPRNFHAHPPMPPAAPGR